MRKARAVLLGALLVVLAASLPAAAFSAHSNYLPFVSTQWVQTQTDLGLANPGFEEGFREVDGIAELKVANGWYPWWDEGSARPEYKIATPDVDPRRVRNGNGAQQWFNNYATHTAGIYQRVEGIPVGATLIFEAWVQAFSSNEDDFDQSNGKYRMRIGIDPYGGLDPESSDVVWSNDGNAIEPYDGYYYLQVETESRSDRVTVYLWGQAEWALKHNDAYCDDTRLYRLDDGTSPSPSPDPGGLTEDEVRAIVREELAAALRAAADAIETTR